ncbi:MAG: PorP/SprF family type IX secretion system membrane protein [Cyclobacteriaceae bacterium]|jgi:type IX secretion system PorP/SprF family membrane protein
MKWLLSFFSLIVVFFSWAQNDITYSHYLLNPVYYNPAFVGKANVSNAVLQFRSQWTGYRPSFDNTGGAPLTQTLTAVIPMEGKFSAFGIQTTNDRLGPVNNMMVGVPLSYSMNLKGAELTIGANPTMYSQVLNFNYLRFVNPSDPFNIGRRESQILFNISAGAVLSNRNGLTVGVSALNINQPRFDYGLDSLSSQLRRTYSLLTSYEVTLGRNVQLVPNLHLRTDASTFTFDLGTIVNYKRRGWVGLAYRYAESVSFLVGYSMLAENKLQVGFALDYVVDEQQAKQPTSQELYIRYNLPNLVIGGRKQVKTPRFAY